MSIPRGAFAGAVLAGGESRRMGRNKALLRVDGEPLWQRQVRVLRAAGADPVIIVRREGQRRLSRDLPHVRDRLPDSGPLAGLEAALTAISVPWLAVLAVDMPAVDAAWFRWLSKDCRAGVGAVARHAETSEPLAAIYPREALAVVTAQLERGERSMQGLVMALARGRRMRVVPLPPSKLRSVTNWNSPADLRNR